MDSQTPLDRAIAIAGGLTKFAEALDVSKQVITNWRSRGVPAHACKAIEGLTGVSVKELRPHDWAQFWPEQQAA